MSLEAWGDEGDVPSGFRDTQIYQELCALQSALYRFYERNKSDIPNEDFSDAFKRADDAIQDMIGQLDDGTPDPEIEP